MGEPTLISDFSVVEDRPADAVSAFLVFKDKGMKVPGNVQALPVTLGARSVSFSTLGRCSCNGLDGIGGGTQIVLGDVSDAGRLAG